LIRPIFGGYKIDELIKSHNPDSFFKKSKLRRANRSGVRRTDVRRSDFEMQRNTETGRFTELPRLLIHYFVYHTDTK
jgi:hypothetical protein